MERVASAIVDGVVRPVSADATSAPLDPRLMDAATPGRSTSLAAGGRAKPSGDARAALRANSIHENMVTDVSSRCYELREAVAALAKWDKRTVPGGFYVNRADVLALIDAALATPPEPGS